MNPSLKVILIGLSLFWCAGVASCDSQRNPKGGEEEVLSLTDSKGGAVATVPSSGKQLLLQLNANTRWILSVEESSFLEVSPNKGEAGEYTLVLTVLPNDGKERKTTIVARSPKENGASAQYTVIQQGKIPSTGGSSLVGDEHIYGDISLIELPRLSGSSTDYFITHRVDGGKRVNYSLEYNVEAHHSRWVCFSFDKETKKINTKRSDAWSWDPMVPAEFEVYRSDFESSIFARGHLVASYDRVFSREANVQTFYYTNMSPQRHTLNEGIWQQMEQLVQGWGRSLKADEVLYVAKGGTIQPDQIGTHKSNNKLVVPKYYWMALLKHNRDGWSAVGLLCEHSKPHKVTRLFNHALSIDELEEFTGLDFFFNLPDEVEERVEAIKPNESLVAWPGL